MRFPSGVTPGRKPVLVHLKLERKHLMATHFFTFLTSFATFATDILVTFTFTITKHKTSCIYLSLLCTVKTVVKIFSLPFGGHAPLATPMYYMWQWLTDARVSNLSRL